MKKTLIFSALLLSSCATTAKYEAVLNSYIGHPKMELIGNWGVPTNTYAEGDVEVLEYKKASGTYNQANASVWGNTGYGNGLSIPLYCNTRFMVRDGKIYNWSWNGNACVSK